MFGLKKNKKDHKIDQIQLLYKLLNKSDLGSVYDFFVVL